MAGIMVSVATGVMNSLLTKLTTLLGEEYKLQKGMKGNITFLKLELSSMNALLEKLAETEVLDPQQQEWRNQVSEMAYDIEDCIDEYMHRLHQDPGESSGIKGLLRKTIKKVKKLGACPKITEQIKELKTRIVEASERRDRYRLDAVLDSSNSTSVVPIVDSGSTGVVPIDPRLPALYAEASDLVGIDVPREELIKLVNDGEEQLKVVSIVGLGGLGKTTLANQIYKKVGEQYDCQAFVSVSQKPDVRKILRTILSQFKKQEYDNTNSGDEEWIINALRDFLKDKRYLIVIDDIWSTQAWKIIKCALLENACGSRIIVTSRIATVAKSCCSPRHDVMYELKPLSEADSKSLFFRRIFGSEGRCPPHLNEVSIGIIKKCGGLPLAIITISSLLTTKSNRSEEWVSVWNSIGSGLEKNSDVEEMKGILSLSYNDLPRHLKTCLLYLSMYPEDYEIWRVQIVRRWIAEGFVKVDGGRNLREEGECYFNELINRSMIQPAHLSYDGQALTCRVHDMILEVIISKAVEESFISFMGDQTHMLVSQDKVRRLSLDYRGQENAMLMSSRTTSHVRSLSIFGYSKQMPPILDFQALRVVNLERCEKLENRYLRNIGKLSQLRYLRINARTITWLPEQIGELQFLETLDLQRTGIRKLPASIVNLRRLKWLLVDHTKLPDGVGNMQALEVLGHVVVVNESSISSLQSLGSLTKLRKLSLVWRVSNSCSDRTRCSDSLVSSLGKLCSSNLQFLYVDGAIHSPEVSLDSWSPPPLFLQELCIQIFCLHGIPEWMASLANLTRLSIRVNRVTQETFQILGDIPALLLLDLKVDSHEAGSKERLTVRCGKFRCLQSLRLRDRIMGLRFEVGAMPKLVSLSLSVTAREVKSVCGLPDLSMGNLSALRTIDVHVNCGGARVEEVEALEAAIRKAAGLLPNRPTPDFFRRGEGEREGHTMEDPKQQEEISTESRLSVRRGG